MRKNISMECVLKTNQSKFRVSTKPYKRSPVQLEINSPKNAINIEKDFSQYQTLEPGGHLSGVEVSRNRSCGDNNSQSILGSFNVAIDLLLIHKADIRDLFGSVAQLIRTNNIKSVGRRFDPRPNHIRNYLESFPSANRRSSVGAFSSFSDNEAPAGSTPQWISRAGSKGLISNAWFGECGELNKYAILDEAANEANPWPRQAAIKTARPSNSPKSNKTLKISENLDEYQQPHF